MLAFNSELFSWIACRFRGRADLEVEVIALRHQLAVLRAQRPGRARLSTVDRLIWVWLYRAFLRNNADGIARQCPQNRRQ
jgi:hypothetical protein